MVEGLGLSRVKQMTTGQPKESWTGLKSRGVESSQARKMFGIVVMVIEVLVVTVGWKKSSLRLRSAGTTIGILPDRTKE